MLLGYGNFTLSFAIDSTHHNAAFLTSSAAMNDGRSGGICSIKWDQGTPAITDTVTITVTVSDPLDATAALGVVGLVNVQGVVAGLKCVVGGVTQRLVAGARGELSSWWIPLTTGNSFTITLFNDVAGATSLASGATIGIGEIFAGRCISLPTLIGQRYPSVGRFDTTAGKASGGGQDWPVFRKIRRTKPQPLGPFSSADVGGGSASSTISSGGNPAGKIDLNTLIDSLATSAVIAMCDMPSAGKGGGTLTSGLRFDQTFMQPNWQICRLTPPVPEATMDQSTQWTWAPTFQEST